MMNRDQPEHGACEWSILKMVITARMGDGRLAGEARHRGAILMGTLKIHLILAEETYRGELR